MTTDVNAAQSAEQTSGGKVVVSTNTLKNLSVHVGHRTNRWHPAMKSNIAGEKNNIHIIDLNKTNKQLNWAYQIVKRATEKNGRVLFVGTRPIDKQIIAENAIRSGSFYVNQRWLGGLLTNFKTVSASINRYKDLERMEKTNFEGYTKKEGILLGKQLRKYDIVLKGIKLMTKKPDLIFVISPKIDHIVVTEARKLGIPIIAIVDTNYDPSPIDVAIPGNDDAPQSVALITTLIADAICEAKGNPTSAAGKKDDAVALVGLVANKVVTASEFLAAKAKAAQAKAAQAAAPKAEAKPAAKADEAKPVVAKPATAKASTAKPVAHAAKADAKPAAAKPVTAKKPAVKKEK